MSELQQRWRSFLVPRIGQGAKVNGADYVCKFVENETAELRRRIAELEGARAKADLLVALGFTADDATELEQLREFEADVRQAAHDARGNRKFAEAVANAILKFDDNRTKKADRAPAAQAEPQDTPCTGAEFVASAQTAIEPRSDEEISEIITDLETR